MSQTSAFRALHHGDHVLVLPNAWDAGGARVVESLGAKAIATTSAGVAWALGYRDGNQLPVSSLAVVAASIVRVVRVPVSIDVEAGYSDDANTVADNVKAVVACGVAGINLEDGSDAPAVLAAKIEAIKRMAAAAGIDVFVNARTDVYLQNLVADDRKLDETLARAATYRAAGADGLFVPALTDPAAIEKVAAGAKLPLNVLAWPGLANAAGLAKLGVRRLTAGSAISQMIWNRFGELSKTFLDDGASETFARSSTAYRDLQALFTATETPATRSR